MRGSSILQAAKGRPIPKEPVPFKAILPMQLKEKVSGKGDNTSDVACIYEMSVLLACFKANDFEQSPCNKEIELFKNCYTNHMQKKSSLKQKEAKGVLTPGERSLSHKQLNRLLARYPNPK